MKVYVETNPETIYSGRVKDEVNTTEIRMWFETDEEIEVQSLTDYTKQVRKEVVEEIREQLKNMDFLANDTEFGERFSCYSKYKVLDILLKVERNQVKGESNVKD